MATIKVSYNSIARRFNIDHSTTWEELESKLRSLYNIPTTSLLTVSYTDEDGDVITLSSDLELKEVLEQQSSGRPIKLVLNSTANDWVIEDDNVVSDKSSNLEEVNNNLVEDVEESTDSILQQQQDQTKEQQTVEREEENDESRPPSYYQHVTINDEEEEESEFDQTTPILNNKEQKEKEFEKQHHENTKDNKTENKKENNDDEDDDDDDDDDDEIIFIISNLPNFFGPRFGPFGGPRFGLFDGLFGGPRHCPFSPFNFNSYNRPQYHHHRSQYYRPNFYSRYGVPSTPSTYYSNSRQCGGPNACGQKFNACNENNSNPSYCSKSQQSTTSTSYNNKNAEASTSKSNCNRNSRPSCGQNFNFFHPRYYYNQTPLTQEQLNDKLSKLHSMGFDSSNNTLYEDFLKRYNGNLERVIELLLRNQQINEHYDNDNDNEEAAPISESKKFDNEGNKPKPYVL